MPMGGWRQPSSVMRFCAFVLFGLVMVCGSQASIDTGLYSVSSKSQGAPFDLVVTEIKREPDKSYLSVPGFHNRTAAGSRWLMCAYTDLALQRGFSYWIVSYPPPDSDVLVVGLTNSSSTSAKQLLGKDYTRGITLGDEPMPVEKMFAMCGLRR